MRSFVDTNILVYAEDKDAKRKHAVARDLVVKLWESGAGVLSIQVLQEFFVTTTSKLKRTLSPNEAEEIVRQYLAWEIVGNTSELLMGAIVLHRQARLSFWDALIVQAAIESGCSTLYSEDMNAGQNFGALTIVNPFK